MKTFYTFLIVILFAGCKTSEAIYIIRHAEKSTEPKNNPHLTDAGKQRAETLQNILKDKKISYIFSTEFNRTIETAKPLSQAINVPVQFYKNDTLGKFLARAISLKKNVLIIGHSNTILPMLDELKLTHTVTSVADNVYNNLFIVKVKKGKAVSLTETTYGSSQ